jgi:hypothetical protein
MLCIGHSTILGEAMGEDAFTALYGLTVRPEPPLKVSVLATREMLNVEEDPFPMFNAALGK